jgi:hypothetical protein
MPANAFGQTDADTRVDLYEDAFLAFDQSISLELAKQIARGLSVSTPIPGLLR